MSSQWRSWEDPGKTRGGYLVIGVRESILGHLPSPGNCVTSVTASQTRAITEGAGIDPLRPAAIPAYLFAIGVASFVLNIPGNQLSRKVEASADRFALDLTGDPQALIDLQLNLARTNLSDPDPPAAFSAVFATHPSTVERIAAALSDSAVAK